MNYQTTILNFRRLLETHQLSDPIFERINANLAARGLFLKQGTIVDASLIAAPSSTKNADGKRDQAMHQSKKGNQYYFGAKLHIGIDSETGLVHSLDLTVGNVADITHAHHLLRDEDKAVMGDAGYTKRCNRTIFTLRSKITVSSALTAKRRAPVIWSGQPDGPLRPRSRLLNQPA